MGFFGPDLEAQQILKDLQIINANASGTAESDLSGIKGQGKVTAKTPDNVKGTKADIKKSEDAVKKRRAEIRKRILAEKKAAKEKAAKDK